MRIMIHVLLSVLVITVSNGELICPRIHRSTGSTCQVECSDDSECAGELLCCPNACGGGVCISGVESTNQCDIYWGGGIVTSDIPWGPVPDSGKCPTGTMASTTPAGDRVCCYVETSFSDEPVCPRASDPFSSKFQCGTQILQPPPACFGCCPEGWTCSMHAGIEWAVCCPETPIDVTCANVDCAPERPNCVMKEPDDCEPSAADPCYPQHICEAISEPVPDYCEDVICNQDEECKYSYIETSQSAAYEAACVPKNPNCGDWVVCAIACEFGNTVNSDGCPICHCNPPPDICRNHVCPGGQKCILEEVQCVTSPCHPVPRCVPEAACNDVQCDIDCANGYTVDVNGCPICECAGQSCPSCPIDCQLSTQQGPDGCPLCECIDPTNPCEGMDCGPDYHCKMFIDVAKCNCPPSLGCVCPDPAPRTTSAVCVPINDACGPVCNLECNFGLKKGPDGCPVCECNDPPKKCQELACGSDEVCRFVTVEICPGCTSLPCSCTRTQELGCVPQYSSCPEIGCGEKCEYGYSVDTRGCTNCQCNPPPKPPCTAPACSEECRFGYVTDTDGCQTCICKHPCDEYQCPGNQECKVIRLDGECSEPDSESCLHSLQPGCVPLDTSHCSDVCSASADSCPYGFVTDSIGCETCMCSPFSFSDYRCPVFRCAKYCRFGYQLDEYGCKGCECKAPTFPIDVCGSDQGPLTNGDGEYLECSGFSCPSGSECAKFNDFLQYEVCCYTRSGTPEENNLNLDIIRTLLTFPQNFNSIKDSIETFKSEVINRLFSEGIDRNQIQVLQIREGSIIVDMQIDVKDDNDKKIIHKIEELTNDNMFSVIHLGQTFTASNMKIQYSYTLDQDHDDDDNDNDEANLIIPIIAGVAAAVIVIVVGVFIYILHRKSKVHDVNSEKKYQQSMVENKRASPPPSYYSNSNLPEKV